MSIVRERDTIFALSSGRLPAGIAVIRVSGHQAFPAVESLCGHLPEPRRLELKPIRSRSGHLLDMGLVVLFHGPHSFTGEDCAELHVHGGRAVVSAVFYELASIPGLRQAEAGEFSLRAFEHGKFDLTAAEALADLIDAETEAQRRFAVENSNGRNARLYSGWRETLLQGRALIEAELDFPDEADVPGSVSNLVWTSIELLTEEIDRHVRDYRRSEIIRDGYRVAIVGAPNVGKSSLLNTLARRDVAIVSDEPGTTRDLIEVSMDLGGLKVIFTDTAGIREGAGPIERQGIARARDAAKRADLVLHIMDQAVDIAIDEIPASTTLLRIRSKIDMEGPTDSREAWADVDISAVTGQGIDDLMDRITREATRAAGSSGDPLPFRERHVAELIVAQKALREFIAMRAEPLELAAEQLRIAADCLARIVGKIGVDDLLDVVFSRFCIGK